MSSADLQRSLVSWGGKFIFSLIGAASVFFLAKLAFPVSQDLFFSLLPQLLDSIRGYLSPPYLFVFINFMIFLILKLSDEKKSIPKHQPNYVKAPSEVSEAPPSVKEVVMETTAAAAPPPPPTSKSGGGAAVEGDHASMDETWMTIMQKRMAMNERPISKSSEISQQMVEEKNIQGDDEHEDEHDDQHDDQHDDEHDHGHDEDEDHDEMNRQFEAFIKKVNDQIRLQSERSSLPSKENAVNN